MERKISNNITDYLNELEKKNKGQSQQKEGNNKAWFLFVDQIFPQSSEKAQKKASLNMRTRGDL